MRAIHNLGGWGVAMAADVSNMSKIRYESNSQLGAGGNSGKERCFQYVKDTI